MENTSVHSLADEISPLTLAFVGDVNTLFARLTAVSENSIK